MDFEALSSSDGDSAFTYDATNQLTDADHTITGLDDEDYDYDDNGNRTNGGYTVGLHNQMSCDGTYTYEYDAEGNRTKRYDPGTPNTDVTEYTWDHRNRLVQVTHYDEEGQGADLVVEYAYDHGNRWVRKIFDPGGQDEEKTIFVYDGNQIALRFHDEGSGELGAEDLTNRYFWGPAVDQILADEQVHWDAGQQEYVTDELLWPLGDHLGSVRDVIDSPGTVKIHRVYDAFGNFTEDPATASHLFAFTARPFDAATGLQNNLHRWYDGQAGRWLSEDPIGFDAGDVNPYRYIGNDPINSLDPNGLWKIRRYFASTARATTERGDTIRQLGPIIGLDPNGSDGQEWRDWLTLPVTDSVRLMPGQVSGDWICADRIDASMKLCEGQRFEIPNTIISIWYGDLNVVGFENAHRPFNNRLLGLGFRVQEHIDAPKSAILGDVRSLSKGKKLQGIFVTAHGSTTGFGSKNWLWNWGPRAGVWIKYKEILDRLQYLLGVGILHVCEGGWSGSTPGSSGVGGRDIVSALGVFHAIQGTLIPFWDYADLEELFEGGRQGTNEIP